MKLTDGIFQQTIETSKIPFFDEHVSKKLLKLLKFILHRKE